MKGFTVKRPVYNIALTEKRGEISQIKLAPSDCLLIQIPFQMQTDMHRHSCMIKPVKQYININLGEISLILFLLTFGLDQAKTERNQIKHTRLLVHTHTHTDKTKTNPLQTQRASMQAGINQSSSQADEVYFTLKEWPTLRSTRDH